jgi:hypothetical protein
LGTIFNGLGDPSNFLAYCPGCMTSMTNVAGQPFSLLSADIGNAQFPVGGPTVVTVTGYFVGGGQISADVFLPATGGFLQRLLLTYLGTILSWWSSAPHRAAARAAWITLV